MARTRRLDPEAAFEFYYNQVGVRRSLQEVADKYDVKISYIQRVSSEQRWRQRAVERDASARTEVDRKMSKTHAQRVIENLKLLDALKATFAKQLLPGRDGRINPNQITAISVKEFMDLIKMELLLTGNPTNISDGSKQARSLEEIELEISEMSDDDAFRELMMTEDVRQLARAPEPSPSED